jgi:hypothetical protein
LAGNPDDKIEKHVTYAQGRVIKNTATHAQIVAWVATTQSGIPTYHEKQTPTDIALIAHALALLPTAPRSCHARTDGP